MAGLNPLMFLPPLIFAGLTAIFLAGLSREYPDAPPTGREGGPAPEFTLSQLGQNPPFTRAELTEPGIKLVNFWASWCAPCRAEHPNLQALSEEGFPVYGVAYKDEPEKALAFLNELGSPFTAIGADRDARAGFDWGVSGIPETFVLDGSGNILLRFAGPITQRSMKSRIRPILQGGG